MLIVTNILRPDNSLVITDDYLSRCYYIFDNVVFLLLETSRLFKFLCHFATYLKLTDFQTGNGEGMKDGRLP